MKETEMVPAAIGEPREPVPERKRSEGESGLGEYFGDILKRRVERRSVLKGAGAVGVGLVIGSATLAEDTAEAHDYRRGHRFDPGRRIRLKPIEPSSEDKVVVPKGYSYNIILKWGDPLFPGAPGFELNHQTRATQEKQFGFNCDFIGYFPLGGRYHDFKSTRALLAVNHEYTSGDEMFPGYDSSDPTADQVDAEIAAHGMTVAEIGRSKKGGWRFRKGSHFNRRITGFTPIEITGPLRGNDLMKTSEDPSGTEVLGMLNNCAGGKTPRGTVLTCEENFDQYFANYSSDGLSDRIPAPDGESDRKWEDYYDRYDLSKEPNEYNRFGYVVEVDPYDPYSKPKKRTALGRCKHEGASRPLPKMVEWRSIRATTQDSSTCTSSSRRTSTAATTGVTT